MQKVGSISDLTSQMQKKKKLGKKNWCNALQQVQGRNSLKEYFEVWWTQMYKELSRTYLGVGSSY